MLSPPHGPYREGRTAAPPRTLPRTVRSGRDCRLICAPHSKIVDVDDLPSGAEQGPQGEFWFVGNPGLARQLTTDWIEAQDVYQVRAWRSCAVLCGGILEALLLHALFCRGHPPPESVRVCLRLIAASKDVLPRQKKARREKPTSLRGGYVFRMHCPPWRKARRFHLTPIHHNRNNPNV